MGVRIVVVLQQDLAHEWGLDPYLGRKIMTIANGEEESEITGGRVVEVVDDCTQTLLVVDRYSVHTLASRLYYGAGLRTTMMCVELLRTAARNLGYSLFRNPFRRGPE